MIPIQLKDMRFCRVYKGLKEPIGNNWTKQNYSYEEINKYFPKENYGVICGINQLGGLDDDTKDKILHKLYDENFPETFQVRGHYYIILEGWDGKKRKLFDKNNEHLNKNGEMSNELGELQGRGTQLVGAGSLHPSGETYKIIKDLPIAKIQWKDFVKVFGQFMRDNGEEVIYEPKTKTSSADLSSISITNIFPSNLNKCPCCGCSSGTNFKVYTDKNSYFCFHAWSGGGIWEAIAISEGIKSCSQIGKHCLSKDESKQIIKIAKGKYGLKIEDEQPQGWALSINIKSMAQRYNLLNCPKCNNPFEFNERLGQYKCQDCQAFGNLKGFSKLILLRGKIQ